ncbi:MAG: beta-galactosidase trimerization domain-containing protein, partial [Pseudomonadota bacterium]
SRLAGCSRLPVLPEMPFGGWPWWFPQTSEDQQAAALAALMHGVKGFNLYMLVDRDRWYGAPLAEDGTPQAPQYEIARQLVQAVGQSNLFSLSRKVEVALMEVRDYRRLEVATSLVDPIPPMLLSLFDVGAAEVSGKNDFGLGTRNAEFVRCAELALDRLGVPYHYVDSDSSVERLARYRLVLVPLFDFMAVGLLKRLKEYVEGGGRLIMGPCLPTLDEQLETLNEKLPSHIFCQEEELEQVFEDLVDQYLVAANPGFESKEVDIATYGNNEGPRVIFLANRSDRSCISAIRGDEFEDLLAWDALTGDAVRLEALHLQGRQVRMVCCKRKKRSIGEKGAL